MLSKMSVGEDFFGQRAIVEIEQQEATDAAVVVVDNVLAVLMRQHDVSGNPHDEVHAGCRRIRR